MARGKEAKLRRRENRKKQIEEQPIDMFGTTNGGGGSHDFGDDSRGGTSLPLPPGMKEKNDEDNDDDSSSEDEAAAAAGSAAPMPKKGKKSSSSSRGPGGSGDSCCGPVGCPKPGGGGSKGGGIKTAPLILLIILTGTTLLPAVIYASDYIANLMAKNHVLGQIGFRLGMGAVPRKRVVSFYEKHAPDKLNDVPGILSKHYGSYPTLIKKLERKYQDYGYFLGWEQDEAPLKLALEQVNDLYDVWIQRYWNRHAPQVLKTAARNVRYNFTFLGKKIRKVWRRKLWPVLEPFLGVPEGAEKQKRKDAAAARERQQKKRKQDGTRRRNTGYRDEEE